jgi:ornithine cyclodeaminase/alanine dehydrogenase-like protein (mu-crystallin family)
MSTLVLTRADVARHMEALTLLEALREGFRAHSEREVAPTRAHASLGRSGGATVAFPGALAEVPAWTAEVHASLPSGQVARGSLIQLRDLASGALLAVMDAGHLSRIRTGLVSALAADVLARKDAATVALVGAGDRASVLLKCLRLVRSLRQVWVWEPQLAQAELFAHHTFKALKVPTHSAETIEEAVGDADIVVTATASDRAFLFPGMLAQGAHVSALGGSEPGRVELSAALIRQSLFFCDDRDLAVSTGALAGVGMNKDAVTAELGEVLAGRHPGRSSPEQVTLFGAVGLPFQDLAAAWAVYESALHDEGVQRVDFSA